MAEERSVESKNGRTDWEQKAVKVIATWFYTQTADEGGAYAQVRGDSWSEEFRDTYRRCVAVFFATARRAAPDARLVLFVNSVWDPGASQVARDTQSLLRQLGVEVIQVRYDHSPPDSWPRAWRNQFYVLDLLLWAAETLAPDDLFLLLDSDVVWSGAPSTARMWTDLERLGCLTYDVGYPPTHRINGLSREEMSALLPNGDTRSTLGYSGGEFIAIRGDMLPSLAHTASEVYASMVSVSLNGEVFHFDEAHILSWAYAALGVAGGTGNPFVRRLWTQPLKPRNVGEADLALALWHVPAEKKYGIRRLYGRLDSFCGTGESGLTPAILGIPRNSLRKWVSDVLMAFAGRLSHWSIRG